MIPNMEKEIRQRSMRSETLEILRSEREPEWENRLCGIDYYLLLFIQSGNLACSVKGREYLLTAGDVLLMGPGEVYRQQPDPNDREWIELRINRSFIRRINLDRDDLTRCFDSSRPDHSYLLHPDGISRELLNYLLNMIHRELASREYGAEMYCAGALLQILVSLNRLAISATGENDTRPGAESVVYRILDYINEHYVEDLSLDFLANRFFVSKYHLSREFSHLVGCSVHQYIIQKRLDMAKQMMSAGLPVSEVYQHCGFGDYSNFYRAFKGKYRISPRDYVENLKKETAHRKNS